MQATSNFRSGAIERLDANEFCSTMLEHLQPTRTDASKGNIAVTMASLCKKHLASYLTEKFSVSNMFDKVTKGRVNSLYRYVFQGGRFEEVFEWFTLVVCPESNSGDRS